MKARRALLPILLLLLVAALVAVAAEKSLLPAITGRIKGFTVPARDFLLKGESAEGQPGGRFLLEGITVETRRGSNQINFKLHSPAGVYVREPDGDQFTHRVTSTNTLDVRSRDDRFQLSGTGYEYQPGTNRLLINSNVFTRFDRTFFDQGFGPATNLVPAGTNGGSLTVTSTSLEFVGSNGDLFYRQSVKLTDGESLEMTAGEVALNVASLTNETRRAVAREDVQMRLKLEQGTGSARGEKAIFSSEPGIDGRLELTGHAAWTFDLFSGSAGRLRWQTTSNRYDFVGEESARLRFPASAFSTNQAKPAGVAPTNTPWIDLESDRHRFVPGQLSFVGHVKARQDTNWSLGADRFEVALDATNHPTRLEAMGSFVFELNQGTQQGRATAGHALVTNPPNGRPVVTLTENPRWVSAEFEKQADRIEVLDPLGEPVYSGDGHVRLLLSGLRLADFDWFGARTNAPAGAAAHALTNPTPVLVTAERSRYDAGTAVFSGNVLVAQGTNFLGASELTLKFTPDLKLTNLLATGGVKVRQGEIMLTAGELQADFDGTERNLPRVVASGDVRVCGGLEQGRGRGLGARLAYDGATGEAVLDGNPEVVVFAASGPDPKKQRPPVLTKATQILWNLRDETVRTRGEYSIITLSADAEFPRDCD